jgi:hypothetical protein
MAVCFFSLLLKSYYGSRTSLRRFLMSHNNKYTLFASFVSNYFYSTWNHLLAHRKIIPNLLEFAIVFPYWTQCRYLWSGGRKNCWINLGMNWNRTSENSSINLTVFTYLPSLLAKGQIHLILPSASEDGMPIYMYAYLLEFRVLSAFLFSWL